MKILAVAHGLCGRPYHPTLGMAARGKRCVSSECNESYQADAGLRGTLRAIINAC